jgi:hypothetical protein
MAKRQRSYTVANRCRWCGRFFSTPDPYREACDGHIYEEREQNRIDMERYKAKQAARQAANFSKDHP